jgi:predicted phosphatase
MKVYSSDNSVFFDVDDTLILWNPTPEQKKANGFKYQDDDGVFTYVPHKIHIESLKNHKSRGHFVVVWSAGGYKWAEKAVKMLELEEYVDLVIAKPKWCYDDLIAEKILPAVQWKKDE